MSQELFTATLSVCSPPLFSRASSLTLPASLTPHPSGTLHRNILPLHYALPHLPASLRAPNPVAASPTTQVSSSVYYTRRAGSARRPGRDRRQTKRGNRAFCSMMKLSPTSVMLPDQILNHWMLKVVFHLLIMKVGSTYQFYSGLNC